MLHDPQWWSCVRELCVINAPFVQAPAYAIHVCADPEAAVADMVYPALQLLQSTVAVSHNVPPNPVAKVGVPPGQVQVLAAHVGLLKVPLVLQVAVPLPLYPVSHVTGTVAPVAPVKKK